MNPYRTAHTILNFWPLWLVIALIGLSIRFFGWPEVWPVLVGFGAVFGFVTLIVGYSYLMDWLDCRAERWARDRRPLHAEGSGK